MTSEPVTPLQSTDQLWVVIVNWQRPEDTIECLQSIERFGDGGYRILVVDNGSQDDSIATISAAFPNVDTLELPENCGYAGGYNAGIAHAMRQGATALLLLNNDTAIDNWTLELLLDSHWDIAVPKILFYEDPQRIWAAGARWRKMPPSVIMRGFGRLDRGQYDEAAELDYATGCALLVRRSVLEKVEGFDPAFGNYAEDYDFCLRAREAGFSIGYVPDSRVYHKVSSSLGKDSPQKWWYLGRNSVLFYRKHERFSSWMLWCYLSWVLCRETLKGNLGRLPDFWRGVRAGLHFSFN